MHSETFKVVIIVPDGDEDGVDMISIIQAQQKCLYIFKDCPLSKFKELLQVRSPPSRSFEVLR